MAKRDTEHWLGYDPRPGKDNTWHMAQKETEQSKPLGGELQLVLPIFGVFLILTFYLSYNIYMASDKGW